LVGGFEVNAQLVGAGFEREFGIDLATEFAGVVGVGKEAVC